MCEWEKKGVLGKNRGGGSNVKVSWNSSTLQMYKKNGKHHCLWFEWSKKKKQEKEKRKEERKKTMVHKIKSQMLSNLWTPSERRANVIG